MSERMKNGSFTFHDEFLTCFTGEQFIDFRQEDMKLLSNSRSSHIELHTPMTTFTGHTKSSAISESQTALDNFKRGTKRNASAFPIFKNDLYYDTFQRSFLATLIMILIIMNKNYSKKNNCLYILYWLLLFRHTSGEN